jgi:hypothetical protein
MTSLANDSPIITVEDDEKKTKIDSKTLNRKISSVTKLEKIPFEEIYQKQLKKFLKEEDLTIIQFPKDNLIIKETKKDVIKEVEVFLFFK